MQASTMHDGGRVIPLVTQCEHLYTNVDPEVGEVYLQFVLIDGEDKYPVTLKVQFGRIDRLEQRNCKK